MQEVGRLLAPECYGIVKASFGAAMQGAWRAFMRQFRAPSAGQMVMRVLLIGRTHKVLDGARTGLNLPDVELEAVTNAEEAAQFLRRAKFSHVFMGAGIDLDERLKIVRFVFDASDTTTIHIKDVASGLRGFYHPNSASNSAISWGRRARYLLRADEVIE